MIKEHSKRLQAQYFSYTGKINEIAMDFGNNCYDQHKVSFYKKDLHQWESRGMLKVYCPAFLMAFNIGEDYALLNRLFNDIEVLLDQNIPLHIVLKKTKHREVANWFVARMEEWVSNCLIYPENLEKICREYSDLSYDRSIFLQDVFSEDYYQNKGKEKLSLAIAHLKTIYIAMAPHYSIEAQMDDSFINCPWHLPELVNAKINKIIAQNYVSIDWRLYLLGMKYYCNERLSPDLFRFYPILSSIIKDCVVENNQVKEYIGWDHFTNKVIDNLPKQVIGIFEEFAYSMRISLQVAVFAGWMMLKKDLRKRGLKFLRSPDEVISEFVKINQLREQSLKYYYKNYNLVRDVIGKRQHNILLRLIKAISIIEYYNSYIGCYKFIPWKLCDENFLGKYLPYNIMQTEKANLYQSLLSDNKSAWKPNGYWFRNVLKKLVYENPSLYSKWFIPLLRKEYIDELIIKEADEICMSTLQKM